MPGASGELRGHALDSTHSHASREVSLLEEGAEANGESGYDSSFDDSGEVDVDEETMTDSMHELELLQARMKQLAVAVHRQERARKGETAPGSPKAAEEAAAVRTSRFANRHSTPILRTSFSADSAYYAICHHAKYQKKSFVVLFTVIAMLYFVMLPGVLPLLVDERDANYILNLVAERFDGDHDDVVFNDGHNLMDDHYKRANRTQDMFCHEFTFLVLFCVVAAFADNLRPCLNGFHEVRSPPSVARARHGRDQAGSPSSSSLFFVVHPPARNEVGIGLGPADGARSTAQTGPR